MNDETLYFYKSLAVQIDFEFSCIMVALKNGKKTFYFTFFLTNQLFVVLLLQALNRSSS